MKSVEARSEMKGTTPLPRLEATSPPSLEAKSASDPRALSICEPNSAEELESAESLLESSSTQLPSSLSCAGAW